MTQITHSVVSVELLLCMKFLLIHEHKHQMKLKIITRGFIAFP